MGPECQKWNTEQIKVTHNVYNTTYNNHILKVTDMEKPMK